MSWNLNTFEVTDMFDDRLTVEDFDKSNQSILVEIVSHGVVNNVVVDKEDVQRLVSYLSDYLEEKK